MDRTTGLIAAVLVAILCCFGIAMITAPDEPGQDDTSSQFFDITYEMDGKGENNVLNPTSYKAGVTTPLYPASVTQTVIDDPDDYDVFFGGWYLDPDFDNLCMEIAPDMTGDIKLYAKWQDNVVGRSIVMEFSGVVHEGIFNNYQVYGTQTITYCSLEPERGYYMTHDTEKTVDYGITSYTTTNSFANWNGESGPSTPVRTETIDTIYGKKMCEVYTDSDGGYSSEQWIGATDGLIYQMQVTQMGFFNTSSISYSLKECNFIKIDDEVDIRAYADEGITVTGGGVTKPMEDVTLTATAAEGYEFQGWVIDGKLNENPTIQFTAPWSDIEVFALNTVNPDYKAETSTTTSIDLNSGQDNPRWYVTPKDSSEPVAEGYGDTMTLTLDEAGQYKVFIEDETSGYLGYRTMFVGGDVVRTYEWNFKGQHYTLDLTINYQDLLDARDRLAPGERHLDSSFENQTNGYPNERQYFTVDDLYVMQLASDLLRMSSGMSDYDRADFVLAFLQSIEYKSDAETMGIDEYWKFPLETLYDMGGDCEDSSILYCTVMKAMGYDTALLILPGHAMASIHLDGLHGPGYKYVVQDNVRYYYVESTADDAHVGWKSPGVGDPFIIIPL